MSVISLSMVSIDLYLDTSAHGIVYVVLGLLVCSLCVTLREYLGISIDMV